MVSDTALVRMNKDCLLSSGASVYAVTGCDLQRWRGCCKADGDVMHMQRRPTTQPRDYITRFTKNFPAVKVNCSVAYTPEDQLTCRQHIGALSATVSFHDMHALCHANTRCAIEGLLQFLIHHQGVLRLSEQYWHPGRHLRPGRRYTLQGSGGSQVCQGAHWLRHNGEPALF